MSSERMTDKCYYVKHNQSSHCAPEGIEYSTRFDHDSDFQYIIVFSFQPLFELLPSFFGSGGIEAECIIVICGVIYV